MINITPILDKLDRIISLLEIVDRNTRPTPKQQIRDAIGRSFDHMQDYNDRHAWRMEDKP